MIDSNYDEVRERTINRSLSSMRREEERGAMRGRARPRKGGVTLSEERKRVLEYIKHAQGGKERIAISREEDKGGKCGERARWADSPIEKCSMSRGRCARCAARIVEVRGCLGWKGGRKEQVSRVTVGRVVEGERPTHTALSYEEHSDRGTLAAWRIMGCVRCCLGARRVVRGQERFVRCRRGREICERRPAEERGGGDIRARLSSGSTARKRLTRYLVLLSCAKNSSRARIWSLHGRKADTKTRPRVAL